MGPKPPPKNRTPPRESGLSPASKRLAPPSRPEMATHRVKGQQDVNNQGATAARSLSFDEDTPPTWFLCFFDDFETRMQELLSTKLKEHEEQIECVRFDLEQAKGKIKALEDNTQKLIDKLEDLENRSRRNNVILHGVPETDNEDCRETVTGLLTNFVGLNEQYVKTVMQRVHRTPTTRARVHASAAESGRPKPRIIHIALSSFQDKITVFKACVNKFKQDSYQNYKLFISDDLSKGVQQKRKAKMETFIKLKKEGKRPFFVYPDIVKYRNGANLITVP